MKRSVSFFEMPAPLRLLGKNGQHIDIVWNNTANNQRFNENILFVITAMIFDPEKQLISKNNLVTLDVEEVQKKAVMNLYPNPTYSILNLKLLNDEQVDKVLFYNALGQIILSGRAICWDISQLASGIYYLKVFNASGITSLTFIKS